MMTLRFFRIPTQGDLAIEASLNQVLNSHRILRVDRNLVDDGSDSFWAICVEHLPPNTNTPDTNASSRFSPRSKVDYRVLLSESDFAVFAKLRDRRKEIAARDAVPVYAIFTNEQLAQMVLQKANSNSALEKISGIGDARVAKYGDAMLQILCNPGGTDEANGAPD